MPPITQDVVMVKSSESVLQTQTQGNTNRFRFRFR